MLQCNKHARVTVSPAFGDWVTKGAHVHVGGEEVRIYPDEKGSYDAEPIRRRGGVASQADVSAAMCALHEDKQLREDLIAKAESVMEAMNSGQWGSGQGRAAEMMFLIVALRR